MSTAPSVQVAPGVTVTAEMTPTERYNAIAKAQGAPTVERPVAPPQFHTPATLQRFEQGDRGAVPIAQRGLDPADLRPTSAQLQGRQAAPVEIDEAALNKLEDVYRSLGPQERDVYRATYERDLRDILEGRKLGESREQFIARQGTGKPADAAPRHAGLSPPTPEALAAQNSGGNSLEQFDAEMRAKGLQTAQREPPESSHLVMDERTGIAYDPRAVERCNALYRALPANERDAARQEYQDTLAEIYAGKLTLADMENEPGKRSRTSRETAPSEPAQPRARSAPAPAAGWQSHVEGGEWVNLDHVTLEDTSGYTIPRYVTEQLLHASTFDLLKQARAAGISQAQVTAVLHQQAVNAGWVKA